MLEANILRANQKHLMKRHIVMNNVTVSSVFVNFVLPFAVFVIIFFGFNTASKPYSAFFSTHVHLNIYFMIKRLFFNFHCLIPIIVNP